MKLILHILAIAYIFNSPIHASERILLDDSSSESKVEKPRRCCCSLTNCLLVLVSAGIGLISGYGYKAYGSAEGVIGQLQTQLNNCVVKLDQVSVDLKNVTQSAVNDCNEDAVGAADGCAKLSNEAISACQIAAQTAAQECISACGKKMDT